jgi:hypothetical protein
VAWYGGYELRVTADRSVAGTDPVVNAAEHVQRWLAGAVTGAGAAVLMAVLAVMVGAAVLIQRHVRVRVGRI